MTYITLGFVLCTYCIFVLVFLLNTSIFEILDHRLLTYVIVITLMSVSCARKMLNEYQISMSVIIDN